MASKALVVGAYQRKLEEIAAHPNVELVAVVPPSWRDGRHDNHLERLHLAGYQLIVSPLAVNGNFHLFFFPELGSLLDRYRPDIVHLDEEAYNLATFLGAWQCQRRAIPCLFFTWQNLVRRYPPPFAWMERYVFKTAAAAIAGTESAANVLRTKGFTGTLTTIPQFGVDPSVYRPSPDPPEPRPFTIGYAGRLVPEKGITLLVDACAQLETDYRLLILGDGPEDAVIRARVAEKGMQRHVELRGAVASRYMPAQLQRLDALVLPSLSFPHWTEQFGRILIEAMACEIPVIGSSSGEIPNVVGDAGIIFPEGDVDGLASALEHLARDAELRTSLGAAGRRRVLEHFTYSHIAGATVDMYRRVAAEVGLRA